MAREGLHIAKANHPGALAAAAGALAAVGLLVLMMLVVEMRPAQADGGGGAFNVTNNTVPDYSPDWSPAGKKIAYRTGFSRSAGLSSDIYTINVGGAAMRNLTNSPNEERDPSFSPDGTQIAYAGWDGQDWEIYTMSALGGERTQLTDNTTNELEIDWSPTGEKIAYESQDPQQGTDKDIFTMTLDPAAPTVVQVTDNTTYDTDPSFSPDGTQIAYAGSDGHDLEIYTKYVGGGQRTRLTNNSMSDTELSWSPTGKKIAYKGREVTRVDGRRVKRDLEIYTIGLGAAHKVVQLTHNYAKDGEPTHSPDGQKIAYEGKDPQGTDKDIFIMSADGGG